MDNTNSDSYTTFGELLRHLRQRARLTQDEFGRIVGYSRAHVARLESGQRMPVAEAVRTHFIAALGLGDQPALAARLIELASAAHEELATLPGFLNEKAQPAEAEPPTFVAREPELAHLHSFLDKALAGHGQIAFVTGEPGSGKTMLLQEFTRRAQSAHPNLIVANGNCNSYTGSGDPYLPFFEIMAMLCGDVEGKWAAGALTRAHACRLWALLPEVVPALVDDAPELIDRFVSGAALLARAHMGAEAQALRLDELLKRRAAAGGGANVQRADLFEQYTKVLQVLARKHPIVLVTDDLQWADAGSIDLLFHLGKRLAGTRILLLGAYRPSDVALGRAGERHPLEGVVNELQHDYGDLRVDLAQAGGRQFVDALLDSEPNHLGAEFRDMLYRQTDGYPLFTVELLHGLQERGDLAKDASGRWIAGPALDWETLPARVEAMIAERMGRLPAELQTALAIASVEGETFTAQAVSQVQAADGLELIQELSGPLSKQHHLVSAVGVRRLDGHALSSYRFRHFLFQKYLYQQLDEVERAHLHEAIGKALEGLCGERSEDIALQLARHFDIAGLTAKAITYLRRAGDRANRLFAYAEAISLYRRAIDLLMACPDTPERADQELRLRNALGAPLLASLGFCDAELERNYARARELTRRASATPELFQVLAGLKAYYDTRLLLHPAMELAEDMLRLAGQLNESSLTALANHHMCATALYLGGLADFTEYRQRSHEVYVRDRERHRAIVFQTGIDSEVAGLSHAGWAEWLLGHPDTARQRSQEAIAWADELGHPFMRAMARFFAALLYSFCGDLATTRMLTEETIALSREFGFAFWQAAASTLLPWARFKDGRLTEAMTQYQETLAQLRMIGGELGYVQSVPPCAEVYARVGKAAEGLALLEDGLNQARANEYGMVEPELYRSKGVVLLSIGKESEAEACFWQAIESARRIEGRSYELRAVLNLCRLWQRQGKSEAAYNLLSPLYSWFTEGHDTQDLKEAADLLHELASQKPDAALPADQREAI